MMLPLLCFTCPLVSTALFCTACTVSARAPLLHTVLDTKHLAWFTFREEKEAPLTDITLVIGFRHPVNIVDCIIATGRRLAIIPWQCFSKFRVIAQPPQQERWVTGPVSKHSLVSDEKGNLANYKINLLEASSVLCANMLRFFPFGLDWLTVGQSA